MNAVKRTLLIVLANIGVLCIIEGLASGITVASLVVREMKGTAERVHTRYDADLGWVNIPNVFIPDLYGPGKSLRTNAQGFRNDAPVAPTVPNGRLRIICSGDSFTLGYGVSNADAWCNRLETVDPRLEPVNMGQGGYGVDQAYLWYRRDGTKIQHDIQILAFITDDFARMRGTRFLGYPKPVLALDGGHLVVRNVPVPHRSEVIIKLRAAAGALTSLRTVQLIQSWVQAVKPAPTTTPEEPTPTADPERPIVATLFQTLRDLHQQRGSLLILVYLPLRTDYDTERSGVWRTFVREEAERDHIPFIDLVDDLRTVRAQEIEEYFIKPGEVPYARAEGHYTARGHEFVAQELDRRLVSIPAVAARLGRVLHDGQ
jgi:hypothetical protein